MVWKSRELRVQLLDWLLKRFYSSLLAGVTPGSIEWRHGILVCKTTQLLFHFCGNVANQAWHKRWGLSSENFNRAQSSAGWLLKQFYVSLLVGHARFRWMQKWNSGPKTSQLLQIVEMWQASLPYDQKRFEQQSSLFRVQLTDWLLEWSYHSLLVG
jgi:hypothetical protein